MDENTIVRMARRLCAVHLAVSLGLYVAARQTASPACLAMAVLNLGAGLLAALAAFHARLLANAREEAEAARLAPAQEAGLFGGAAAMPAARTLEQAGKYILPALALLILAAELFLAWRVWSLGMPRWAAKPGASPLVLGAVQAAAGFVLLLAGKYAAGIAGRQGSRPLTAAAGSAVLAAAAGLLAAAGNLFAHLFAGAQTKLLTKIEPAAALLVLALVVLLALDRLLSMFLAVYRPRRRQQQAPPCGACESQLAALCVQPQGLLHGLADMLNYQFGFNVSETWFYALLHRALLPLACLQAVIFLVYSCLVFINPGEVGLLETWGRPVAGDLEPGAHLKLPWPWQQVRRIRRDHTRILTIGAPEPDAANTASVALWDGLPEGALLFLAAAAPAARPAGGGAQGTNLLSASLLVSYRVANPRDYAYNYTAPDAVFERAMSGELLRYLAGADGQALLLRDRGEISSALTAAARRRAATLGLGVEVVSAALLRLQPPTPVVNAYRQVVAASQNRETAKYRAERYFYRTVPEAEAAAAAIVSLAEAEKTARVEGADAFAEVFRRQGVAYRDNPLLFSKLAYYDRLAKALPAARKIVVATDNPRQVIQLDLKQALAPELLDFSRP